MGIGEGILAGVSAGQAFYRDQRAEEYQNAALGIQRERQDVANTEAAKLKRADDARQLILKIDGHLGQKSGPWNKTQVTQLLAERPDLVNNMLNDSATERYRDFTNEKNENVGAHIVEVRKNEDGSYTPMVQRNDTGEVVPMTNGRSADPESITTKLDKETLENLVNARYQAAIGNGGLENTNSVLASAASIIANDARAKALDLAVEQLEDPNQLQQFYGVINDIDIEEEGGTEALLEIYKSLGGDPEALIASGQARADELFAEQQQAATAAPEGSGFLASSGPMWQGRPIGRMLGGGNTQQKKGGIGPEAREVMSQYGTPDRSDFAMVETINAALDEKGVEWKGQVTGAFMEQSDESYAANSEAEDFFNKNKKGVGKIARALNRSPELLEEFNAIGPAAFLKKYQTTEEVEKLGGTETVKTVAFPGLDQSNMGLFADSKMPIAPAPFELTAENLKAAIIDGTSKPTADQATAMAAYLKDNGIDNDADLAEALRLKKLNKQEGLMLAWVMGATAEGDTPVKAKLAQDITNLIARGDQNVGTLQQAQLDASIATGRAATLTAEAKYNEVMLKAQQWDQEAVGPMQEFGKTALDKVYKNLNLMNEEGEFTDEEFNGDEENALYIARVMSGYIPRLKQAQGAVSAAAGVQYLNPMLSLYIQSMANADDAGIFGKETYKDLFRLNPDGTTDFDLTNVRVAKVKDGKPVSIAYVDQEGVRSQAVDISKIQKDSKLIADLLVLAATTNGQEQEYKDKGS
tara:strand:- start:9774 stop:12032 length:2259 start_codon:yes stop_codon:yes gene_type:complete